MLHDLTHFIRISRPVNILLACLVLSFSGFIACGHAFDFLSHQRFWVSLILLSFIMAGGYWVNDIFDFKIDRINKPRKTIVNAHLSAKKVFTAYFILTSAVLITSWFMQSLPQFLVNLSTVALLFSYAAWFKRFSVVGNLVIASLTGLVVYYAGLMYPFNRTGVWMTMFAFEITFIREVTKDIEDIRGDLQFKLQTLPIRIGIRATKGFLFVSYVLFLLSCYIPLVEETVRLSGFNVAYFAAITGTVVIPCLFLLRMLMRSSKPQDFSAQSLWLKLLILPGLLSLLLLR